MTRGETVYERTAGVESQRLDDEGVLLDLNSGHYYRLNRSAMTVWELLSVPVGVTKVVNGIAELYGTAPAEIADEVRALIGDMVRLGVVRDSR